MARAAAQRAAKAPGTSVVSWDEQFAAEAEVAAAMEKNAGGGGQWFSIRGGILTFNGAPLPGNEMVAVVVDSILENAYFEGEFDPDNPQPPVCFAFGRDDDGMAPHQTVFDADQAQNQTCKGCEKNVFGSAERGKGKACKNTRRLALLAAGSIELPKREITLFDTPEEFEKETIGFLKLPVTSVAGWAAMVKRISASDRRPPHGFYMHISVVPDPKTQWRVLFNPAGKLPNEVMDAVMRKRQEAQALIEQPYNLEAREAPPPRGRAAPAAAAKTARGRASKF
jgi:hypothetical protein